MRTPLQNLLRTVFRPFVVIGYLIVLHTTAFATCFGLAGQWSQSGPIVWHITQNPNNGVLSGTVDHGPCGATFNINAAFSFMNLSTGAYIIRVEGGCGQVAFWTESGSISGPACAQASGTWQNYGSGGTPLDSGTFTMAKSTACDAPSDETSNPNTWGTGPRSAAHLWRVNVTSTSGLNFGGRTVFEESGGTGSDACYFDGSSIPVQNFLRNPFPPATLTWDQKYDDIVGWETGPVNYYRQHPPAGGLPCQSSFPQRMRMVCTVNPDGSPATSLVYKTNTLVSKIYPSTGTDAMNVGSQRDTASEQKKVWPNLAAPTDVTATEITSTQVRVTWTNNALDQTDFIIARRLESEGTYTEIDGVTGTARSYDDTGSHGFGAVVAGNGYYYCVLAVNGDGVGTIPNLDWTRGPCSAETFVFVQ